MPEISPNAEKYGPKNPRLRTLFSIDYIIIIWDVKKMTRPRLLNNNKIHLTLELTLIPFIKLLKIYSFTD